MVEKCLKQYQTYHECCFTSDIITLSQFSNLGLKFHLLRLQSPVCPQDRILGQYIEYIFQVLPLLGENKVISAKFWVKVVWNHNILVLQLGAVQEDLPIEKKLMVYILQMGQHFPPCHLALPRLQQVEKLNFLTQTPSIIFFISFLSNNFPLMFKMSIFRGEGPSRDR